MWCDVVLDCVVYSGLHAHNEQLSQTVVTVDWLRFKFCVFLPLFHFVLRLVFCVSCILHFLFFFRLCEFGCQYSTVECLEYHLKIRPIMYGMAWVVTHSLIVQWVLLYRLHVCVTCTEIILQRRPSTPMGIGIFQSPTKSILPNRSTKNLAVLITFTRGPPIPNLIQIHPLRASGKMGEI